MTRILSHRYFGHFLNGVHMLPIRQVICTLRQAAMVHSFIIMTSSLYHPSSFHPPNTFTFVTLITSHHLTISRKTHSHTLYLAKHAHTQSIWFKPVMITTFPFRFVPLGIHESIPSNGPPRVVIIALQFTGDQTTTTAGLI